MKAKWLPISAAVALALGSVSASAVDFHGYFRSGLNYATQGGDAYCYGTGNAGHYLGRLADECDTYAEIALTQEVYNKGNNKFTVNTLVAYGTEEGNWDHQGNSWQGINGGNGSAWDGQRASLREVWSDYEMPSGIKLWAGKRYYDRKDIHILDLYYLNNSGTGFGVEAIPVGNLGTAAVALIKQQVGQGWENGDRDINSWKLDARWKNIPLWTDGALDVALIYAWQNLSDNQKTLTDANNGFLAHLEWTQSNLLGGFNKLIFQYGHDALDYVGGQRYSGNHAGDNVIPYSEKGNGYRIIDWGVIEQPKWNLGYSFIITHRNAFNENRTEGGANWTPVTGNDYSFVLRPSYKWNDFMSTVLEFGYHNFNSNYYDGDNGIVVHGDHRDKATKLTIAQQWAPTVANGFWARPSLRVFASWLSGSHFDHSFNGGDDSHQITLGAQVEAWW